MNIEQYRAMKVKEQERTPEVEQPIIEEEIIIEPGVKEVEEPKLPETIEIDGQEVSFDELRNGYLRQSDYTKKTQKLASEKKEIDEALAFYNEVRNNPNALNALQNNVDIPRRLDPEQAHIMKLEEELYDMKLENEINLMTSKYDDFEVREVLQFASDKKMTNLEDAYFLLKARSGKQDSSKKQEFNIDKLKEELKAELMTEMKGTNTGSIISSKQSGEVTSNQEIRITKSESKIASAMGMTDKEYAKWRDANK